MQKDLFASAFCQLGKPDRVVDMRMHTTVTHQPDQMHPITLFKCPCQCFVLFNTAIFKRQRDLDKILIEHPPRTDRHMPHFRVAHLPFGEPYTQPVCCDKCFGYMLQCLIGRLLCRFECIAGTLRLISDAIGDNQYGFLYLAHKTPFLQ